MGVWHPPVTPYAPPAWSARLFIRRRISLVRESIRRRVDSALPPRRTGGLPLGIPRHQASASCVRSPTGRAHCLKKGPAMTELWNEKTWNKKTLWNEFIDDEKGVILSAELVLILTIAVIGMVVGLSHVALAVNQELSDIACAIGALNQSYSFTGFHCCWFNGRPTSFVAGSSFTDWPDVCDCAGVGLTCGGGEIGACGINSGFGGGGMSGFGGGFGTGTGSYSGAAVPINTAVVAPCVDCLPGSVTAPIPDHVSPVPDQSGPLPSPPIPTRD